MTRTSPSPRYRALRAELTRTLADASRWRELPGLLEALERARHADDEVPPAGPPRRLLWIDRFAGELLDGHTPSARRDHVRRTAQALWPWLGTHDPVAIARGQWDGLPRSYA